MFLRVVAVWLVVVISFVISDALPLVRQLLQLRVHLVSVRVLRLVAHLPCVLAVGVLRKALRVSVKVGLRVVN